MCIYSGVQAQGNLADALLLMEKNSNTNIKCYIYNDRAFYEMVGMGVDEKNGFVEANFNAFSGSNIFNTNIEKMIFLGENIGIYGDFSAGNGWTYKEKTLQGMKSDNIMILIDNQIVLTSLPRAFFETQEQYDKFFIEDVKNVYIKDVLSITKPTDYKKNLEEIRKKIPGQLQKHAEKLYAQYASLIREEKPGSDLFLPGTRASKTLKTKLVSDPLHQQLTKDIKEKTVKDEKELEKKRQTQAKELEEKNNAILASFGKETLTFEENFAKWSAKGQPKLIYYTGISGFFSGVGTRALMNTKEFKHLEYKTINDSPHSICEYRGGIIQKLEIANKKEYNLNYLKREVDNVIGQSGNTALTALKNAKKSYFYTYNSCAIISGSDCDKKPQSSPDARNVAFWIKGNLVIVDKSRGITAYLYVYAYPGATPLELKRSSIDDFWLYVEKVLYPQQVKDGGRSDK